MVYLNEEYPYRDIKAIACYYSYDQTCILRGEVDPGKKLIICEEINFEKQTITFIADYLKKFNVKCWINKHDYLAGLLKYCYCLDFQDEQDCDQLSDLFRSLLENNRVEFKYDKQPNIYREKALPIITKALNYALFTDSKPSTQMVYVGGKYPSSNIRW